MFTSRYANAALEFAGVHLEKHQAVLEIKRRASAKGGQKPTSRPGIEAAIRLAMDKIGPDQTAQAYWDWIAAHETVDLADATEVYIDGDYIIAGDRSGMPHKRKFRTFQGTVRKVKNSLLPDS